MNQQQTIIVVYLFASTVIFLINCGGAEAALLRCYQCTEGPNRDGCLPENWKQQECFNGSVCALSDVKGNFFRRYHRISGKIADFKRIFSVGTQTELARGCVVPGFCEEVTEEMRAIGNKNFVCDTCSTDLCNDRVPGLLPAMAVYIFFALVLSAVVGVTLVRYDLWKGYCKKAFKVCFAKKDKKRAGYEPLP